MSERRRDNDDAFAERVARVLGPPERFGDDFEQSLAAAIRADRPLRLKLVPRGRPLTPAWWVMPSAVRLSPLEGLLLAASLAVAAVASTVHVVDRRSAAPSVAATPAHDTVTFVRFVFVGEAKTVSLVGDFNQWGSEPTALSQASTGMWSVSVPLSNGRYEYAFIVDGKRWVPDPLAPTSSDDFDTKSSIITIGT